LLVVALASSGLLGARAAETGGDSLAVVGTMPLGSAVQNVKPMWIDSANHEGIAELTEQGLQTYDLANLRPLAPVPFPSNLGWISNSTLGSGTLAAIDQKRSRMFWPATPFTPLP